jgi:hypothetical protein
MPRSRQRVEINMDELRRVLDKARQQPIEEAEYLKMKVALDVLAERLTVKRTTEKARAVVAQPPLAEAISTAPQNEQQGKTKGHGRNSAADYTGARKIEIRHAKLTCGDACPECARGKVYTQRQPKTRVDAWPPYLSYCPIGMMTPAWVLNPATTTCSGQFPAGSIGSVTLI